MARESWLAAASDVLERTPFRIAMSVLIVASVSPIPGIGSAWRLFFAIFAIELLLRAGAYLRSATPSRGELFVLLLDGVATAAFLPFEDFHAELRLLRLARLVGLVAYWLPYMRELVTLTLRPDRWRQLAFVAGVTILFCTIAAAILTTDTGHGPMGVDMDGDGEVEPDERGFVRALWWAFLQIESPDNLARQPSPGVAFFLSWALTIAGLFLFSFFIGIGASLVSDLVASSRLTPVGFRKHVAILNPSPDCQLFLRELFSYYRKQYQVPKVAVLGSSTEVPEFLLRREIRRVRYRTGQAALPLHLGRVDVAAAKRVVVLKNREEGVTDAQVVSTVMTVRELNPTCTIYAEVKRGESASAALVAGGPRTHGVLTTEFQGLMLASLVIFPGMRPLLEELLSSQGKEIYSCIFGEGQLADVGPVAPARAPDFVALARAAYECYEVGLVGSFGPRGPETPIEGTPHLRHLPPAGELRGLLGVCDQFAKIRSLGLDLARGTLPAPPPAPPIAAPALGLPPAELQFRRVLICGFRTQTRILLDQLVRYSGTLDVTILLPERAELRDARDTLLAPTTRGMARRRISFSQLDAATLAAVAESGKPLGTVRLVEGDWSLLPDLREHAFAHDVMIVSAEPSAADPDARTATGILKLASLMRESPESVPRHFHLVGEVKDETKVAVLARRFAELPESVQAGGPSIDLISIDRLRSELLAQSVMVPGIGEVLGDLLSQGSEQLARLVPRGAPAGEGAPLVRFPDLWASMAAGAALPIAVEIDEEGAGPRTYVCPRAGQPGFAFPASRLRAVYVVGPVLEEDPSRCAADETVAP